MVRKRPEKCSECGAELRLGPARCPLCGCDPTQSARPDKEAADETDYHSRVQELRDQLRKLREEGAEAV